jgi:hypothetical protein
MEKFGSGREKSSYPSSKALFRNKHSPFHWYRTASYPARDSVHTATKIPFMYFFLGVARSRHRFWHSCVCGRFVWTRNRSIFLPAEWGGRSWECMNSSQTWGCGGWDWDPDSTFLGNICFEISVFCLCSAHTNIKYSVTLVTVHSHTRTYVVPSQVPLNIIQTQICCPPTFLLSFHLSIYTVLFDSQYDDHPHFIHNCPLIGFRS